MVARIFKPKNFLLYRALFFLKKNLTFFYKLTGTLFTLYLLAISIYNFIEFCPSPNTSNYRYRGARRHDYMSAANYISRDRKTDDAQEQLAFFLQIQRSTLHLLPRLFNRIYHPANVYIVHFDTDVRPGEGIKSLLRGNVSSSSSIPIPNIVPEPMPVSVNGHLLPGNVKIMPSETVNYMGVSMTLNTINAMQVALDFSSKWRYFINISGNDYPLVSPTVMRDLLSHKGRSREFFCFKPLKRKFWHRFSFFSLDSALDLQNMERPVYEWYVPNPMVFYSRTSIFKAEAWMIVSRQFARFITHSSFARRILLLFSYSIMSDEMYFATIARNTLFNTLTVNDCMRQIEWYDGEKWSGQHPFFMDDLYDDHSGYGYRTSQQEKLRNSTAFFSRKFRRTNSTYMDYIDRSMDSNATIERVSSYFRAELEGRRRKSRDIG